MLYPIKVVDIELSQSIPDVENLDGYIKLKGLVRLHGVPLGYVEAPVTLGRCSAQTLSKLILEECSLSIVTELLKNGLASPDRPENLRLEDLINLPPAPFEGEMPLVTVAVCTRDRPDDMKLCLEAISQLDYPNLEILVVDNAPKTEGTKALIDRYYPQVRYVREPRPGLDWARNRAILEATGEIIAYTDDDVVVDSGWVKAIALTFAENPEVMALTGLVVPYELETEAQVLFEDYGGFGRGFEQKVYKTGNSGKLPWQWLGAGQFGTGANMAFRRSVFEEIGYFDPALDVGTPTNGGGDLEMYIRVLKAGHTLFYEPKALVRHRHRRDYAQLKRQVSFNGSLYALWFSIAIAYPEEVFSCLKISVWWWLDWHMKRTIRSLLRKTQFPRDLVLADLWGSFKGLTTYPKARKRAAEIVKEHGWQGDRPLPIRCRFTRATPSSANISIAVRQVDLSQPLEPLTGLENYGTVRIFVSWQGSPFRHIDYHNQCRDISVMTLSRLLVDNIGARLLDPSGENLWDEVWAKATATISRTYNLATPAPKVSLPEDVPVSVVVATFDRPDDLRNCLKHLTVQNTNRSVEIVVVDNHPASGLTPPVIAEFPGVVLVQEVRQGLAYARNAGFIASSGDILIATDDDVTVPPDWLEKLLQPFARADVMIVTGNVLPLELENEYQQAFENYGGLGRGFETFEVDGFWYDRHSHRVVPTWSLGATANAAFRATIFSHAEIGLMDECLGPGMPSGVGEDTYLFYKVLKAGYTIVYTPEAYVWHKHRRTQQALKRQLYGYSKGHVCYNLTTWLRDGDWRGLIQLLFYIPYFHYYRIKEYLLRRSNYPISLVLLEIAGNLAGPWSLWRSRVRVSKEGPSDPFPTRHQLALQPSETPVPSTAVPTTVKG